MSGHRPSAMGSGIVLYQTEDGRTRVECRFEEESIWLTQALIAELFQKDVRTINEHLHNLFTEGELGREATIRTFRIVRSEEMSQPTFAVPTSPATPGAAAANDRAGQRQ